MRYIFSLSYPVRHAKQKSYRSHFPFYVRQNPYQDMSNAYARACGGPAHQIRSDRDTRAHFCISNSLLRILNARVTSSSVQLP